MGLAPLENFGVFLPETSRHLPDNFSEWAHSQLQQRLFLTVCTSTMTKLTFGGKLILKMLEIIHKRKHLNTSTHFRISFLLLGLIHFFIERLKWLDVMHLMYWLLGADQNWYYCRNSNRICRYRSISSLTPKRSKETARNYFRMILELIKTYILKVLSETRISLGLFRKHSLWI